MAQFNNNNKKDSSYQVPAIFAGPSSTSTPGSNNSSGNTYTSRGGVSYEPSAAGGGYVPSAAAQNFNAVYTPSATASGSTYTPSAAASGYAYNPSKGYTTSNAPSTSTSASTGGYVPSAAAMGNLSLNNSTGYTPSAAASATNTSSSYVPSAAAMGSSSYVPSATATASYVPSAAAQGNGYNSQANNKPGTSTYVPSAAAQGIGYNSQSNKPSTSPSTYVPSAAAQKMSVYTPSLAAQGHVTANATSNGCSSQYNQYTKPSASAAQPYVPSAAAQNLSSVYTPSAAATASSAYKPQTTQYAVPSMFNAPPVPAPAPPAAPKPSQNYNNNSTSYQTQPQYAPTKPNTAANQYTKPSQQQPQQQQQRPTGVLSEEQRQEFEANQPEALKHADIWMISGCEDKQTSADISNVNAFQLPDPHGRAGGACTAALLNVLYENDKNTSSSYTFQTVMMKMRNMIRSKGLSQIPQLSSTHAIDMNRKFELVPDGLTGRRRAVIIGINYKGQKGELRGCHNDAFNMKKYIQNRYRFPESDMTLLIDDGSHAKPTKANILAAYKKVVAESRPGDAIFLHYSGHGTKVKDLNGDEDDGYDEALVPLDFKRAGQIIDDDLYTIIVGGLPKGVHVVSVMDCCHSGTILDLPYIFKADGKFQKMEIENSFNKKKLFSGFGGGGAGNVLGAFVVGGILGGLLG